MAIDNYTPEQIEEILQAFFEVAGTRKYIGARYVPIFGRGRGTSVDWDNSDAYEPLSIVYYQGDTYTSRRYVPAGIPIDNQDYWVITGRYNAQVEQYRQEVLTFSDRIDGAYGAVDALRNEVADEYVPFPDPDHYPKYGTANQVLSTLTNGETKWVDPVIPDSETVGVYVDAWLDDHPEATTTVQDGAVTTPKLANNAVTDAKIANVTNFRKMYPTPITSGSGGNYASHLTDLNNAAINTIYKIVPINFTAGSQTANLPSGLQAYKVYMLETIVAIYDTTANPNKYQRFTQINLENRVHYWEREYRTSSSTWTAWVETDLDGVVTTEEIADNAVTDAKIANVTTFRKVYPHPITTGSGGNYASYLTDLNNAAINTVYKIVPLNFTEGYQPSNLPSGLQAYNPYLLETVVAIYDTTANPNKYQRFTQVNLENGVHYWERLYNTSSSTWTDWVETNITNMTTFRKVYPTPVTTGSGGNYASHLSDLNNAAINTVYKIVPLNFTEGYQPSNLPSGLQAYNPYLLETVVAIYDTTANPNKYQRFTQVNVKGRVHYWERQYTNSNDTWSAWIETDLYEYEGLNIVVGSGQQYTSILRGVMAALAKPHSHVLVKSGTYDIAQEILDYYGAGFLSQNDVTYRGIPLGNYITVEFESGAVAELDLSDASYSDAARSMVSIFNSGDSNPEYSNTGFTLINATLIGTDCRYCVHDEHGGVLDNYSNHYINCRMHKICDTQYSAEGYGRSNGYALGGGLGEHGYITIEGCTFTREINSGQTTDVAYPIFYHTSLYSQTQESLSEIYVRDCYFDTTIMLNRIGTGKTSQMFVSGCSCGIAPEVTGSSTSAGELIAWNNEIRTP